MAKSSLAGMKRWQSMFSGEEGCVHARLAQAMGHPALLASSRPFHKQVPALVHRAGGEEPGRTLACSRLFIRALPSIPQSTLARRSARHTHSRVLSASRRKRLPSGATCPTSGARGRHGTTHRAMMTSTSTVIALAEMRIQSSHRPLFIATMRHQREGDRRSRARVAEDREHDPARAHPLHPVGSLLMRLPYGPCGPITRE